MKDIKTIAQPFSTTLKKYSLTIFIVLMVGGLSAAVLLMSSALQKSSDTTNYIPAVGSPTFDQSTIKRVNQLHTSNEQLPNYTVPTGRTNPFTE
jgi:hypothetical protein